MYALSRRGDAREVGDSPEARTLEAEALGLKRAGIRVLDALVTDEGRIWLEVFRLPSEDIDLVFDLRSIALLCEDHASLLGEAFDPSGAALAERSVADALEVLLVGPAAQGEWGQWVARAFTLTLSLYLEVCRIGQLLGEPKGTPLAFPSVARIARSARRNRSAGSYSMVDTARRDAPISAAAPEPALKLAPAAQPELAAVPEPARPPASAPLAAPPAAPAPPSVHPPRRFERLCAELEVSLVSTSNFYLGFTENLSEGGLFVATYAARPLGSEIEISVRLPDRTDALVLRGIVRWHREYSATSDGYPGMGIQFDALSETDKADIAAFLVMRPPLFFVD
jgi:uncharacterized protein (TIGR02266 family)